MTATIEAMPLVIGLGRFALACWMTLAAVWWLIRKV